MIIIIIITTTTTIIIITIIIIVIKSLFNVDHIHNFPSVSFSTGTFTLTNESLRLSPFLKPTTGTSGNTLHGCG